MKADLSGKVALVTGAARNIGKCIADTFAANGAKVVYADVDLEIAQAAAAATSSTALRLDVTNDKEIHEQVARIVREFGSLDILVNNAGTNTAKHRVTLDEFPRHEWDRLLAVDLTGLYVVSQAGARVYARAEIRAHYQHRLGARPRARTTAVRFYCGQSRCRKSIARDGP